MAVPGTQSSLLPWPVAPSLIPWAALRQIPRGLPPFPPFLPQLRAARQTARTGPNHARIPPVLRPLLGPLSPAPATTVHGTRPAVRLPFLVAPRRWRCRGPPAPPPECRFPRRLHAPRPRTPPAPKAAPLRPQPSPARGAPKVIECPGTGCAPRRTDRRSPPVTCGSGRRLHTPAAGPPLPHPFPSRHPCAPSGPVWGGQSVRTRPSTGLRTCARARHRHCSRPAGQGSDPGP